MASYKIKKLEDILAQTLGRCNILSVNFSKLTSAGDNYGGALVAVDVTVDNGRKEEHRMVAKVLPQSEFIQKMMNSQQTFRNEVGFYQTIIPCLQKFQKQQGFEDGLNLSPDFYGARFSLNPSSTKIDEDGVLLMKNLKDEGFTTIDRKVGFDLDTSKLILKKISELHATSYALKVLNPKEFDEKLGPFFQEFKVFDVPADDMVDSIIKILKDDDFCMMKLPKIKEVLNESEALCCRNKPCDGRFNGLIHCDLWSNNIMVKYNNSKTVDVKFVDFQLYEYNSFTRDVLLFLFTSVQLDVLRQNSNDLISFYFESFVDFLKKLKCQTEGLTLSTFLHEMGVAVKEGEFFHVMIMLRPIYLEDNEGKEVEDIEMNDFLIGSTSSAFKEKAYFIVHEFARRGWL